MLIFAGLLDRSSRAPTPSTGLLLIVDIAAGVLGS
jgi:hypothetical protein